MICILLCISCLHWEFSPWTYVIADVEMILMLISTKFNVSSQGPDICLVICPMIGYLRPGLKHTICMPWVNDFSNASLHYAVSHVYCLPFLCRLPSMSGVSSVHELFESLLSQGGKRIPWNCASIVQSVPWIFLFYYALKKLSAFCFIRPILFCLPWAYRDGTIDG